MDNDNIERTYDRVLIKIKLIGLFQIIGGILGIGVFAWLASVTENVNFFLILLYIFIVSLYAYSILCGIMLFRKPVTGLRLTFINQVLQILQIAVLGYVYKYLSGFGLVMGFDLTNNLQFSFNFEFSSFLIHWGSGEETLFIKINILAILLAYYSVVLLERYQAVIRDKEAAIIIDDIGQ